MMDLLKKLISARSTPDKGESTAAEVIAEELSILGLKCSIDTWDKGRANVVVQIESAGRKPAILFASHLDVVPAGSSRWKYPPFEAKEAAGRIFGRGASDMKGGIAAIITAIKEVVKSGVKLQGDIIFAATAGEETDSCGAKRFVETAKVPKLAGIIVTEPTDLKVVNAHRGMLWLKFTAKGKAAHSSMPHLGINAIESVRLLLNELANFKLVFTPHPQLNNSSMSVNTISGGKAANIIPDECSIVVDIRTLPDQRHNEIVADFNRLLDKMRASNAQFVVELDVIRDCPALETSAQNDFVRAVCQALGADKLGTVSFTTDGPFFGAFGAPVIIFGPGKPELCHQPDEYIEITDVEKAVKYYKSLIMRLLT
jgi:succinyl-diaminopimelate desuccinylase